MSNDRLKIKEIKSTSDLGCTLDTERPWVSEMKLVLPNNDRDVEVRLKDGTITFGWLGSFWWVDDKFEVYPFTANFPKENPDNPVVAWRELEK